MADYGSVPSAIAYSQRENIQVMVRVRPLLNREQARGRAIEVVEVRAR